MRIGYTFFILLILSQFIAKAQTSAKQLQGGNIVAERFGIEQGLPNNWFENEFRVDKAGRLVFYQNGGVYRAVNNTIENIIPEGSLLDGGKSSTDNFIVVNDTLVLTQANKLFLIDLRSKKIVASKEYFKLLPYPNHPISYNKPMPYFTGNELNVDRNGNIFILRGTRLFTAKLGNLNEVEQKDISQQLSKIWKDSVTYLPVQFKNFQEYLDKWKYRNILISDNNLNTWVEIPGKLLNLTSKESIILKNKFVFSIFQDTEKCIWLTSQMASNSKEIYAKSGKLIKSISLNDSLFPYSGICEGDKELILFRRDNYAIISLPDYKVSEPKKIKINLKINSNIRLIYFQKGYYCFYRESFGLFNIQSGIIDDKLKVSKTLFGSNTYIDTFGALWIGSDNGIFRFKKVNSEFLLCNLSTRGSGNWIWRSVNNDSLFLSILNDFEETVGRQSNEEAGTRICVFKKNPLRKLFEDSAFKSLEFLKEVRDTIVLASENEIGYYSKTKNAIVGKIKLKENVSWRRILTPTLMETIDGCVSKISDKGNLQNYLIRNKIKVPVSGNPGSNYDRISNKIEQFFFSANCFYRTIYDFSSDSLVFLQGLVREKEYYPDFKGSFFYQTIGTRKNFVALTSKKLFFGESFSANVDSVLLDSLVRPTIDNFLSKIDKFFMTKNHFGYINEMGVVLFNWSDNKLKHKFIPHSDHTRSSIAVYYSLANNTIFLGKEDGIEIIEIDRESLKSVGFIKTSMHKSGRIVWAYGTQLFVYTPDGIYSFDTPDYTSNVAPIPYVESIKINGINCFNYDNGILIEGSKRNLEIRFGGNDFAFPEDVTLSYRVIELDTTWKEYNKSGVINFNDLDPGTYHIQIASRSVITKKVGIDNIIVFVNPTFYETVIFKIFVFVFLVATVFLIVRVRTRSLKKEKEKLEKIVEIRTSEVVQQKHVIEEKHKEITDSINYAERIQRSFLATKEILDKNLNEYFIIFKPKDVVSGDFYWAGELNNGQFAILTADSTGHGVPGAIMSLLNITSVEKAVESQNEPSEILNVTRRIIIERLKRDGSIEGGKDGMDCSLIALDLKKNKMTYSAANNPVWIIRNGQLIELDPDKMPVGKHDKDYVSFSQHEVLLETGDMIYAITDGMPDQFGGPRGKKFMYKQLKDLLVLVSSLPLNEQKVNILASFENWKGDLEQVDDVTIIGIRI